MPIYSQVAFVICHPNKHTSCGINSLQRIDRLLRKRYITTLYLAKTRATMSILMTNMSISVTREFFLTIHSF